MSCNLAEKVSLLIDGELPQIEARAVEHHLLECAECQQVRADFISLRSGIDAYVAAPVPDLSLRLAHVLSPRENVRAQSTLRERLLVIFGGRRLTPALVTVVATLLFACAVALVLHIRSQRHDEGFHTPPETVVLRQPQPGPRAEAPGPQPSNAEPSNPEKPRDRSGSRMDQTRSNIQQREVAAALKPANLPRNRNPTKIVAGPEKNTLTTNYVAVNASAADENNIAHIRSADTETLTAQHVGQAELLLRAFRNLRAGSQAAPGDLSYERRRAQQLFYQNVLLRREADSAGDVEVATLLESLEPILLDIANLHDHAQDREVRVIKDRVERQNLVALLQVNSAALVRPFE